jgi:hypothetical protein
MLQDPLYANEWLLFSRQTHHGRDGDSFRTVKTRCFGVLLLLGALLGWEFRGARGACSGAPSL